MEEETILMLEFDAALWPDDTSAHVRCSHSAHAVTQYSSRSSR